MEICMGVLPLEREKPYVLLFGEEPTHPSFIKVETNSDYNAEIRLYYYTSERAYYPFYGKPTSGRPQDVAKSLVATIKNIREHPALPDLPEPVEIRMPREPFWQTVAHYL